MKFNNQEEVRSFYIGARDIVFERDTGLCIQLLQRMYKDGLLHHLIDMEDLNLIEESVIERLLQNNGVL